MVAAAYKGSGHSHEFLIKNQKGFPGSWDGCLRGWSQGRASIIFYRFAQSIKKLSKYKSLSINGIIEQFLPGLE